MVKPIIAIVLIVAAFFQSTLVPTVTTVTFQPNTSLTQVVELLNAHDTWAQGDNFIIDDGNGFFYPKGSMSITEREHGTWVAKRTFARLNGQPVPQTVTDCILSRACSTIIAKITLLNPSATLLDTSIVASSESHREIHPFFHPRRILGRP